MPILRVLKKEKKIEKWFKNKPERLIPLSFLLIILIGAILLSLPISNRNGLFFRFTSALFTSTSATCVTGLVLKDTVLQFSFFGQCVLLMLIQIGGLGLITITSFFYSFMRKKNNWKTLQMAKESSNSETFVGVFTMIRRVIIITVGTEMIGASLLIWRLYPFYGKSAIWRGIFHAVSAFCNAGFDLYGDGVNGPFSSLTAFNAYPSILMITAGLIILGGLGFFVWSDLFSFRKNKTFSFHSKIVFLMTVVLLLLGFIYYYVFEFNNMTHPFSLGQFSPGQKPYIAFFQSVTTRTAGFNSLDQATLNIPSKFMGVILMFIGAAPGSMAGGIKITTFLIFFATIISDLRGRGQIIILKHKIVREIFVRALAVMGLALTILITATLLISIIEQKQLNAGNFQFIDILYEVTSAFATVGLSTATTSSFTSLSHLILILCMFIGRVGPVTFVIGLTIRNNYKAPIVYPEGKTIVG